MSDVNSTPLLNKPALKALPHQERVADKLEDSDDNGLLAYHALGSGKTFTAINAANRLKLPILAITPASLRSNFQKELNASNFKRPSQVVSYQEALNRVNDPKFREQVRNSLVTFDECFAAGTLVGNTRIEKLKVGDLVPSFDQITMQIIPAAVTAIFQRKAVDIVRVTIGRRIIVCSANHPFATTEGWISAKDLTGRTVLANYTDKDETIPTSDSMSSLSEISVALRTTEPETPREFSKERKGVLQSGMFNTSNDRPTSRSEQEGCSDAYEVKEPYAFAGVSSENGRDIETDSSSATDTWREWNGPDRMRGNLENRVEQNWSFSGSGCDRNRKRIPSDETSYQLQNRSSNFVGQDSDRNRWSESPSLGAPTSGCKKSQIPGTARVDRVEVLKYRSAEELELLCPGGVLYNIEVDPWRTYVVDGIVVHNSHRMGQEGSARSDLPSLLPQGKRLLLAGTPIRNRPEEIGPLINATHPGALPDTAKGFRQKFIKTREVPVGFWGRLFGVKPGVEHVPTNLEDFSKAVRGRVDYHDNIDRSDFPSYSESIIEVPMAEKQQAAYDYLINKYPAMAYKVKHGIPPSLTESKNFTAFFSGPRMASNHPGAFNASATDADAPKFHAAADEIEKRREKDPNFRGVVYSNFLGAGVDPMKRELDRRGIPSIKFTGELNDKQRQKVVNDYNSGKAPVLLLSGAGAEGLDLKGTKLMQILEPHWNEEQMDQVRGRAIRYKSHEHLPESERHVEVQRFHAAPVRSWIGRKLTDNPHDRGIDQYLYEMAQKKRELNQPFLDILKEEGQKTSSILAVEFIDQKLAGNGPLMSRLYPDDKDKRFDYSSDLNLHALNLSKRTGVDYAADGHPDFNTPSTKAVINMLQAGVLMLPDKETANNEMALWRWAATVRDKLKQRAARTAEPVGPEKMPIMLGPTATFPSGPA
jgi:superfamily II DNA or RNA helicase